MHSFDSSLEPFVVVGSLDGFDRYHGISAQPLLGLMLGESRVEGTSSPFLLAVGSLLENVMMTTCCLRA